MSKVSQDSSLYRKLDLVFMSQNIIKSAAQNLPSRETKETLAKDIYGLREHKKHLQSESHRKTAFKIYERNSYQWSSVLLLFFLTKQLIYLFHLIIVAFMVKKLKLSSCCGVSVKAKKVLCRVDERWKPCRFFGKQYSARSLGRVATIKLWCLFTFTRTRI